MWLLGGCVAAISWLNGSMTPLLDFKDHLKNMQSDPCRNVGCHFLIWPVKFKFFLIITINK
jgi:hypothetical protein